jgi:uncharacterized membrane protein
MEKRGTLIFGLLLVAVLAAISALAWPHIPDAPVAVHFGMDGRANGFWPKWAALAFGPAAVLGLALLLALTRAVRFTGDEEPDGNGRAFDLVGTAVLSVIAAAHMLILLHAEGRVRDVGAFILPPVALLLLVMGNGLGKLRRNGVIGIRTPWSLASAYAWEKSNRAAGRLFVALGILVLLADMLSSTADAARLLVGGSLATAAVAAFLSWHYWRRDPARNRTDA